MQTPLARALTALYPTLNFADLDGTLAKVRYDAPLPAGFVPPTQAELDAEIARLDVPLSVSPLQCRLALNDFGIRAQVEAAVVAGSQSIKDKWDYATEIRRDDPDLNALATAIGLTSAQVDSLFKLAATKI